VVGFGWFCLVDGVGFGFGVVLVVFVLVSYEE
jgi:hypothetical protein